ncbi:ABC transporter ATP-binding protein [Anthocerotibacter panamensis]|uniref:ABC transporter ATP-binding protein n=1 Tax=Anthocerotibacter panamensis TaxID=2857077 RepID=UPI001C406845|nr:ABC transporter ATP-binding protein [Anthocerotibacter panamensis]
MTDSSVVKNIGLETAEEVMPAIRAEGLVRRFGAFTAVDGVTFAVPIGSFFGFLGPNGAGKSTTIKMLTGLLAPTAGRVEILGYDLEREHLEVKRSIGVVPEDLNLFERLTGPEYLTLVTRLYGIERKEGERRQSELFTLLDLKVRPGALIVEYSTGMKKKLALAAALIHGPKVLFLDEPFEGVDAIAARTIKDLLAGIRTRGTTIFLTSHILDIVERLCTDIAILNKGKIVAVGSVAELRQSLPGSHSLEDYFLNLIGGQNPQETSLSWMS